MPHLLFPAQQYSHFSNPCLWIMAPKAHPHISLTHCHSVMTTYNMRTILAYSWLALVWSVPIPDIGRLPCLPCFPLSLDRTVTDHLPEQFRTQDAQFRDSSDDGSDGPMIHHAFDKMFDGQDGFPFVIGGSNSPVTNLHPSGVQIFQLWQIYLENVNPLLKVTHTPTIQGSLIEAAANPAKIAKPLEALMFSIYFIAVVSMTESEVRETFQEDKNRLLSKYHHGTQQALINAGFMRSPDLVVLQAYVMYLVCDPFSHLREDIQRYERSNRISFASANTPTHVLYFV